MLKLSVPLCKSFNLTLLLPLRISCLSRHDMHASSARACLAALCGHFHDVNKRHTNFSVMK